MSNIIDSIQLSGSSYDVRDKSATTVVTLTQAEYDSLPSSAKTDTSKMYVITDALGVDITTTITSASTNSQVPTAKAVYDVVGDIETLLSQI